MNVIIVGCGRVGAELASRLDRRGNQVAVIDRSEEAFKNLPLDFRGRTIEGEALSREVLIRAGINKADGFVTVTNSDTLNTTVAHIARECFHVPHIVARNYDPRWRDLYEAFKLEVISSSSWGAQRIEELLYQADLRAVFSAGNGEVEIYEFRVPVHWEHHTLQELLTGLDCIPVALIRIGRAHLPTLDTVLREGDTVNVSASANSLMALRDRLSLP